MRCQPKRRRLQSKLCEKGALVANRRADPYRAERLRVKAAASLLTLRGERPPGKHLLPRNKAGHHLSDECPALFILNPFLISLIKHRL